MFPNIRAEMGRNDLNCRKMAERCGVSVDTFKNWMSGRTEIPISKLLLMARMFNCTTDYLLGYKPAATDAP